jgi:hypothetical protein
VTFVGDDAQILDGCAGPLTDTQCATDGDSHAGAIRQQEIGGIRASESTAIDFKKKIF